MTQTDCTACAALARIGVRCNAHRTESSVDRLLRQAREAGVTDAALTAEADRQGRECYGPNPDRTRLALAAEVLLGFSGVVVG